MKLLRDVVLFSKTASGIDLRAYQIAVAESIVNSVLKNRGLTFVVIFPRQSGKNELQAQIETYLLTVLAHTDAEIVKVSPTWKPQTQNAMRRLQRILDRNLLAHELKWSKESGYIYRIEKARIFFLSGSPTANVVGATASTLLECDEAQDVLPSKWDKDFAPMAASTNATRVFWGTAWTSRTLLARELRAAQAAEKLDGIRRVFMIDANTVSQEVPAYGKFVEEQVAKLGRQHPMVKTQFFSEEIDGEGGMFPARRLALLAGSHPRIFSPGQGKIYCLLVDVAGEDEGVTGDPADGDNLANPRRDSTALTVVEVDLAGLADPLIKAPAYKIVDRKSWIGTKHPALYGQIRALAELWSARYLVVDATGVGAGLASFLDKAMPGKVIPYVFNSSTKSKLGWDFLSLIETGRLKDYAVNESFANLSSSEETLAILASLRFNDPSLPKKTLASLASLRFNDSEQEEFIGQLEACQMEIIPGPDRRMKWGVPDGTRSTASGAYLHDDWILSAALAAVLDAQPWSAAGPAIMLHRPDPLLEIDREGF
jgi:hypothetical protein